MDIVNVLHAIELIQQYKDIILFEGLACVQSEYHIELDPSISPMQHVPRVLTSSHEEELKEKLDNFTQQGIIQQVTGPMHGSAIWWLLRSRVNCEYVLTHKSYSL